MNVNLLIPNPPHSNDKTGTFVDRTPANCHYQVSSFQQQLRVLRRNQLLLSKRPSNANCKRQLTTPKMCTQTGDLGAGDEAQRLKTNGRFAVRKPLRSNVADYNVNAASDLQFSPSATQPTEQQTLQSESSFALSRGAVRSDREHLSITVTFRNSTSVTTNLSTETDDVASSMITISDEQKRLATIPQIKSSTISGASPTTVVKGRTKVAKSLHNRPASLQPLLVTYEDSIGDSDGDVSRSSLSSTMLGSVEELDVVAAVRDQIGIEKIASNENSEPQSSGCASSHYPSMSIPSSTPSMSPSVLSSKAQSTVFSQSVQSQRQCGRTDHSPSSSHSRAGDNMMGRRGTSQLCISESNNAKSNHPINADVHHFVDHQNSDNTVPSQGQSSNILSLVGHILEELVTTERSYCRSLYVFSEVVAKTVCTKSGVGLKDLRLLFPRCLPELYSMHVKLLYRLDLGMATFNQETIPVDKSITAADAQFPASALLLTLTEPLEDGQLKPNDAFHSDEPSTVFFLLYKQYLMQFTVAMETMRRLLRQSSKFRRTLKGLERHADCEGSDFSGFLLAPVQRLPRYLLLMKQLVRHLTKLPDTSLPIGGIPISEALAHARQAETHLHTILVHLDAQVANCLPKPPDIAPIPSNELKLSPVPTTTGEQMSPRKLTQVHSARIGATRDTAKCLWPRIRRAFSEIQDKHSASAGHPTQPDALLPSADASGDVVERIEGIDKPPLRSTAVLHDSNESVHIFSITEGDGRSNASFQLVEVNLAESATPYSDDSKTPDKQMVQMHEDPLNLVNLPALQDPNHSRTIEAQKDVTPPYSHPCVQPTQSLLESGTQTSPVAWPDDRPDSSRHPCFCSGLHNASRDVGLRDHATLTEEHDICLEQPITSTGFVTSLRNRTRINLQRHRSMPTDAQIRDYRNPEGIASATHLEGPISALLVDCHKPIESQSSSNQSSGVNCRMGDVHLECSTAIAPKHSDHAISAGWLPSLTRSRQSSQPMQSARRVQWKDDTTGHLTSSEQACGSEQKTMDTMRFSLRNLFRRLTTGSEDISDLKDGTLHSCDTVRQNQRETSDGTKSAPLHQPLQSLAFVGGTLALLDRLQLKMASINDLLVDNIEETVFLDETGHPCFHV